MNDDLRCRCTLAMQGSKAWPAVFAGGAASELLRAVLCAIDAAGYAVVPIKTLREAHAVMRECGWQLAPASVSSGDGTLETACAEIEENFSDMLAAAPRVGGRE